MQFKKQLRKRYEQGLTLIEASMVLALSAVVVAGVMLYYQSASENNKFEQAIAELAGVQTAVQAVYGGRTDYSGIATSVLNGSSSIPPNLITTSGPVTPWGQAIYLLPCGENGIYQSHPAFDCTNPSYQLGYVAVPQAQCVSLLAQNISGLVAVSAAGDGQAWGTPLKLVNGQIDVKTLTGMCNSAAGAPGRRGGVDVAWQIDQIH